MAGAYCQFCDTRCFVLRVVDDRSVHLATCHAGMAHDRRVTGHDHRTALNPITGRVDLVVTGRTEYSERVCNHDKCLRGRGEGERIRAKELHAAVTRQQDSHDLVLRLHPECLTDLYGFVLPGVDPAPKKVGPVPLVERCPNCDGTRLSWGWYPKAASGVCDGRLRVSDVVSRFYLGCGECSETLGTLGPDDVAAVLTMMNHRTAVPHARRERAPR